MSRPSGQKRVRLAKASDAVPQRKHRKLLKDGTEEVWPEHVEKVFVEGLYEYWKSPWATYSRGRSRWRNQFLVDHLAKHDIDRTKKQIASHVQVLRNMWKGSKEFHLVAGGEELFQEDGLLSHLKSADLSGALETINSSDDESPSTPPETTVYTPPPHRSAPEKATYSAKKDESPYFTAHEDPHAFGFEAREDVSQQSHFVYDAGDSSPIHESPAARNSYGFGDHDSPIYGPRNSLQLDLGQMSFVSGPSSPAIRRGSSYLGPVLAPIHNDFLRMCLWAPGAPIYAIPLDKLAKVTPFTNQPPLHPRPAPFELRLKLTIPRYDDEYTDPAVQGFSGAVELLMPWTTSAKCITRVYDGEVCQSEQVGNLEAVPPQSLLAPASGVAEDAVRGCEAYLPESTLTQCRMLNATASMSITQDIIVDNVPIINICYTMDRSTDIHGRMPVAALQGFRRFQLPYASNSFSKPVEFPGATYSWETTEPVYEPTVYQPSQYPLSPYNDSPEARRRLGSEHNTSNSLAAAFVERSRPRAMTSSIFH